MKNTLMIDIDSERENQVIFSKPEGFEIPVTPEAQRDMVVIDLKTLAHGLGSLIKVAEMKGFGKAEDLLDEAILLLEDYYPAKPLDEDE